MKKKNIIYHANSKPKAEFFKNDPPFFNLAKFEGVDSQNFNTLDLDNNELFHLSWKLLNKFDFFNKYNVEIEKWMEFIWRIERKYNKKENPFHNFHHGLTGLLSIKNLHYLYIIIIKFIIFLKILINIKIFLL